MNCLLTSLLSWVVSIGMLCAQDTCRCEVVNAFDVTTKGGTCFIPGMGNVPCVTAVLGPPPSGAAPDHGTCKVKVGEVWVCNGAGVCAYQDVQVMVTPVACASSCLGGTCSEAKLDGSSFNPQKFICAGGLSVSIQVGPGATSNVCGTPDRDQYVKFFEPSGAVVFEIRFRFGCHACRAAN